MKLEQQVCSLELSKRLRELVVRQESVFYWVKHIGYEPYLQASKEAPSGVWVEGTEVYSAFTVAELGEMLPLYIGNANANGLEQPYALFTSWNDTEGWSVAYCPPGGGTMAYHLQVENTEADARAKCLIYLIENGLIEGYDKIPV